jgi:hypothetical protein
MSWLTETRFRGVMAFLMCILVDQPHCKIEGFLILSNHIPNFDGIYDRKICLRSLSAQRLRTESSCRYEKRRARGARMEPLVMKLTGDDGGFSLDDLLCQRAVQTQLYYFAEFRDG